MATDLHMIWKTIKLYFLKKLSLHTELFCYMPSAVPSQIQNLIQHVTHTYSAQWGSVPSGIMWGLWQNWYTFSEKFYKQQHCMLCVNSVQNFQVPYAHPTHHLAILYMNKSNGQQYKTFLGSLQQLWAVSTTNLVPN